MMARIGLLIAALLGGSIVSAESLMNVQVKDAPLKSAPSFLSSTVSVLHYGKQISLLASDGDWSQVRSGSMRGWLHSSALSEKTILLTTGTGKAQSGVSSNEVMIAGKGFNAQVESQYRKTNPTARFDQVDAMERDVVSSSNERKFASDGKLKL